MFSFSWNYLKNDYCDILGGFEWFLFIIGFVKSS